MENKNIKLLYNKKTIELELPSTYDEFMKLLEDKLYLTEELVRNAKIVYYDQDNDNNFLGEDNYEASITDNNRNWEMEVDFYTKPDRKFFEGPRIVVREIPANTLICAYIEVFALFNKSVFNIRCASPNVSIKYILSILNSKAVGYYIASFGDKSKQTLFPRVSMKMLKQIPIPIATQEQQQSIVDMVNVILRTKEINPSADTKDIENKIDSQVFHLYGLTYDEILIIDPETPITREEYNQL